MRLGWESTTPLQTARRLADLLGLPLESADGIPRIDLGAAILEVIEPLDDGSTDERLRVINTARTIAGTDAPSRPIAFAAVGFATVDTERAAAERGWEIRPARPDRILGADIAVVLSLAQVLLLEPHTEGRIAASLARWGEGPAALYLVHADGLEPARAASAARGGRVTTVSDGPFGREFGIVGPRIWGPHVVLVEADALPSDALPPAAGTIGR